MGFFTPNNFPCDPKLLVIIVVYACATMLSPDVWADKITPVNFLPNSKELEKESCPSRCDTVFKKLVERPQGMYQNIEVRERGEPRSGTTFLFKSARRALMHACHYLRRIYGNDCCRVEWSDLVTTLIFEPYQTANGENTLCLCRGVRSVTITVSQHLKHELPVDQECPWYHTNGMISQNDGACSTADGEPVVQNVTALVDCVRAAGCLINDNRFQMVLMRDPRSIVMSSYYNLPENKDETLGPVASIDEYFLVTLPKICKWLSVRLYLFEEQLAKQSMVYWYEDIFDDPEEWVRSFYDFVGLNFPMNVIHKVADALTEPGSVGLFQDAGSRIYEELTAATISGVNDILHTWLPAVALNKIVFI